MMAVMSESAARVSEAQSVLIVDDQPANLAVLSRLLTDEGSFKVRAVTSGERALEAARLSPPDVVLLDVAMPGMDGYATCDAFRQDPRLADVPIIFVTALDDTAHKVRAFRSGGRDYVTKPFHAEEVLARVHCQLRMARLHAQARALVRDVAAPLAAIGAYLEAGGGGEGAAEARAAYEEIVRRMAEMEEPEQRTGQQETGNRQ